MQQNYSISQLEEASGIKAHTIRIWEKRYGILKPIRRENNIREYSPEDYRKLLDIALLIKNGEKISKIAAFDEAELKEKTSELGLVNKSKNAKLDELALAVIDLDEIRLKGLIDACVNKKGLEFTFEELIRPFLDQMNFLKMTGALKKVHESFVFHNFKSKIIQSTESIPLKSKCGSHCIVTFMPKNKSEILSLLFLQYLSRKRGLRIINLGSELDLNDVSEASCLCFTSHILCIFNEETANMNLDLFVHDLKYKFKEQNCLIVVPQSYPISSILKKEKSINFIKNTQDYNNFLKDLEV